MEKEKIRRILAVSGSRADMGFLEWPVKKLREDKHFEVQLYQIRNLPFVSAFEAVDSELSSFSPDCLFVLGDRFEILAAAVAAHLRRIRIVHLAGGDVTEGSYDNEMRDCVSRLAWMHFPTSMPSANRLLDSGLRHVYMVGSTGIDFMLNANWRRDSLIGGPYVLVDYQVETSDGTHEWPKVERAIGDRYAVILLPNPDYKSAELHKQIEDYVTRRTFAGAISYQCVPHDEFLNLMVHAQEFIGNSSAIFYEAPFLKVRTHLIGKRQNGRVVPFGDGKASERIRDILKEKL